MRASNFINIKAQGMLKDYYKVGKLITNGEFTSAITSWSTSSGTPAYNSGGNGR